MIQIRKVTSALRKKTRLLSFLFSFSVSLFPVIIYEIFTKKILIKFIAGQMAFTFLLYFNHLTSTRNISFYFHSHIIIKKKTVCFLEMMHTKSFSQFFHILRIKHKKFSLQRSFAYVCTLYRTLHFLNQTSEFFACGSLVFIVQLIS